MSAPLSDVIRNSHGYHPVTTDLNEILHGARFGQLLIFGPGVNDVIDLVDGVRLASNPPVQLPQGRYWFSGVEPTVVLSVASGASPGASVATAPEKVVEGSALDHALGWVESTWDGASPVPKPRFAVGDDVVISGSGKDGVVRAGRRFNGSGWVYDVFAGGQQRRWPEESLTARPAVDSASTWVTQAPGAPKRFAATLTRASSRAISQTRCSRSWRRRPSSVRTNSSRSQSCWTLAHFASADTVPKTGMEGT